MSEKTIGEFADRFLEHTKDVGVTMPKEVGIARRRRRRQRMAGKESPFGGDNPMALFEHHGVLQWEDLIEAARPSGRGRGAESPASADGHLVSQFNFQALAPNKIVDYLKTADDALTKKQGLFELVQNQQTGKAEWAPLAGAVPNKKTLLIVHGTFSSIDNSLDEFQDPANPAGQAYLKNAARRYKQILGFGHPTLSVSPFLNAVLLQRAFAGVTADVDVVAHSRGGLVVRWWLDALGGGMAGKRRAVLVGSPMSGTGLASPANIRATMNLLTNFAKGLEMVANLSSMAIPFMKVVGVLGSVMKTVTGAIANTPLADAAIVLVPGLASQSRVGNNFELVSLREATTAKQTSYYTITSNFEPTDPGWAFWQRFRKGNLADAAADLIFDGDNDLVVDTDSMNQFTDLPKQPVVGTFAFGTNPTVHHCNYFRQPQTLAKLDKWLD